MSFDVDMDEFVDLQKETRRLREQLEALRRLETAARSLRVTAGSRGGEYQFVPEALREVFDALVGIDSSHKAASSPAKVFPEGTKLGDVIQAAVDESFPASVPYDGHVCEDHPGPCAVCGLPLEALSPASDPDLDSEDISVVAKAVRRKNRAASNQESKP